MADNLYQLRIKADYEDVTVFSSGPTTDHETAQVGADLVALASATLLVHELRIAAFIRSAELVRAMDAVLLQNAAESADGMAQRRRELHARI
ncbi:hypothetical protein [Streptomyces sp. NPDC005827]|uniref:hypothetical protein n=1 Tax=Streptomyces sp. NPDC005827 TaxID=3157070 RepID=UPI0033F4C285